MTIGVLLMAYGTPDGPDDVARYYTDIRRGRPPSREQLDDLRRRYEAIGGESPLRTATEAQVRAVAEWLGNDYEVALGMKHSSPSIEAAVQHLEGSGVENIVGVVLAPHYSAGSVGEYQARAATAVRRTRFHAVRSWHLHPLLIEALVDRVADEMAWLPGDPAVVFTAHSLPVRVVDGGDPYAKQVAETAAAVASGLGLGRDEWSVAWQSAGRTGERWIGPDVIEVIRGSRRRSLVVCPVGFVSDHLEILYDLDVQAANEATARGISFSRTRSLDVEVAPIVADVVLSTRVAPISRLTA